MAYIDQNAKAKLSPAIKAVLKQFGMKGSISIRHHSTLVVSLASGPLFKEGLKGAINPYWIDDNYSGKEAEFLHNLIAAMKGPDWFDKSDTMTDYFHFAWYVDIRLGNSKPYSKHSKRV